jgi:acetyl-CoA synthetase
VGVIHGVRDIAAIAVAPEGGGPSQLVIYVVIASDGDVDPAVLQATMQQRLKTELNPLFKIHALRQITALPRTASGKIMRRVLRAKFQE